MDLDLDALLKILATHRVHSFEGVVSGAPVRITLHESAFKPSPAVPVFAPDAAPQPTEPTQRDQTSPIPTDEDGVCDCGHTWLQHEDGIGCLGGGACSVAICAASWKRQHKEGVTDGD